MSNIFRHLWLYNLYGSSECLKEYSAYYLADSMWSSLMKCNLLMAMAILACPEMKRGEECQQEDSDRGGLTVTLARYRESTSA